MLQTDNKVIAKTILDLVAQVIRIYCSLAYFKLYYNRELLWNYPPNITVIEIEQVKYEKKIKNQKNIINITREKVITNEKYVHRGLFI